MSDSSGERRPPIPAEIRRRVLVDAGHRCAIPTCRHIEVDVHHIIPWAQCQTHEYDNLIALCPNCHRLADADKIDRKSLRIYKFNLRFAHDKFSQLEMDVLFELGKLPKLRGSYQGIYWLPLLLILLKRLLEAEYISVTKNPLGSTKSFGVQISPDTISLTDKGRAFLSQLVDHEL